MDITHELQTLAVRGHHAQGYTSLLNRLLASGDSSASTVSAFRSVLDAVLQEGVSPSVSRQVLDVLIQQLKQKLEEEKETRELVKAVLKEIVAATASRAVSFEEQISTCHEILADIYQEDEDWLNAAYALKSIPLESGHRPVDAVRQLKTYIRIARLLIEGDDVAGAEQYVHRAAALAHDNGDSEDKVQLKLAQARVLDFNRRFVEASMKFHQVSCEMIIDENDRTRCLEQAIVCAILAPAGPQRSRVLAMLYKDERTSQLGNLYSMLEKVYMDRLLLPDEVKLFETRLSEHHMALLSDNSTVLDRAVLEHNLLSVSRLYDYIRVDALARFLGVDKNRAESVAARMMAEGRMHGSIDQVEQLISFERAPTSEKSRQNEEATGVSGSAETSQALSQLLSSSSSTRAFSRWNEKLLALCTQIEDIAGAIIEKHPELARA